MIYLGLIGLVVILILYTIFGRKQVDPERDEMVEKLKTMLVKKFLDIDKDLDFKEEAYPYGLGIFKSIKHKLFIRYTKGYITRINIDRIHVKDGYILEKLKPFVFKSINNLHHKITKKRFILLQEDVNKAYKDFTL